MKLKDGSNTISDAKFEAAERQLFDRQDREYETVHNGSGRSEEMPSDLSRRHQKEHQALTKYRETMSVAQWVRRFLDQPTQALLNKSPQQELQAQLSLTQSRDREIEQPTQKQTRTRSLSI